MKPDLVLPVPLHWWKRWQKGYDHSVAIARGVANGLNAPIETRYLIRHTPTLRQSELGPTRRWENVRGAFRLNRRASVQGLRILLIDDVLTTGATCDAAASVLRAAGAAQVTVGVLAHR